ncbi:MAG TPA: DMT family transporter [Candidatus Thermoplasmatota archaeon]|nr:DMT family transporter [Candidatus Thermoplasmatota archaeon]
MDRPSEGKLLAALVAVQVAFGGMGVAAKLVFPHLSPFALALARLLAAAVVLVALERVLVRAPRPPARDLAMFALFALLGTVLNIGLYLAGLERTTATNAILLIATIPAFTLLVAAVLGRERADAVQVGGLLLSFAGVAGLVYAKGGTFEIGGIAGDLMVVANSLCYSVYLVLSKPYLARYDSATLVAWVFAFGAVEMSLVAVPDLLRADWGGLGGAGWAGFAYVLLFGTVLTYSLNAWALRHASASHVANFVYLQPVVGVLAAWLILGEPLSGPILLAGVVILAGVTLATRGFRSRRAGNPTE